MEFRLKKEMQEENIRVALADYARYINDGKDIMEDVSEDFISAVATDNVENKNELRELFRLSPCWDEKLDALVINGTRTHNPDYQRINNLMDYMFKGIIRKLGDEEPAKYRDLRFAKDFFSNGYNGVYLEDAIAAINRLAPKAYKEGRKKSRVFRQLCIALGIWDEAAGSAFQATFAQFADEMTSKKINYKLFVSLNPAHFLTMSNPKNDMRGCTLTSCHSFNSREYEYNNGCSGYACDKYSFIVFTVDDPKNPELLNNRKTTRQIFAYKPGSGVLLQSRLYNTSGGTHGAQEESKEYRDLIQREISSLEDVTNLWKTKPYVDNTLSPEGDMLEIHVGHGFGGYQDWIYRDFASMLSVRNDHYKDAEGFSVGTNGRCIRCGDFTERGNGLYCSDCANSSRRMCECCEEYFDEDELYDVCDEDGDEIPVCESCRDNNFTFCSRCDDYYPDESMRDTHYGPVCPHCFENYYSYCDECEEYYSDSEIYNAIDEDGNEIQVCRSCRNANFTICSCCGRLVHNNLISKFNDEWICEECAAKHLEEGV